MHTGGLLAAVLALGLTGQAGAEVREHKGYEGPPYRVEAAEGAVELRRYDAHLVAEVSVAGSRSGAANTGFRRLAGFIFGGNAAGEKIAMTSPVTQTAPQAGGPWVVRFAMPARFDAATLPRPDDPAVRIVTVPGGRMLALRFSGMPGDAALAAREAEARAAAAGMGLRVTGPAVLAFYDSPFTLPNRRRNEVLLPVAD
jgi:hypothetical protein